MRANKHNQKDSFSIVNILLKALMIERNKSSECEVKVQTLKREYINKVKMIAGMQSESE